MEAVFVIVGGGIAGVTCAETLAFFQPDKTIILLSESSLIKIVTNLHAITRTLTRFDIREVSASEFSSIHSNITVLHDSLLELHDVNKYIVTKSKRIVKYAYLCLCTGAEPKLIPQANDFEEILGIRDTDSVDKFVKKIANAKKVIVVGNGGIASELVYKIKNTEVHWVIKDQHISSTFVDPGAAEFFLASLKNNEQSTEPVSKRMRYKEEDFRRSGAALGPDWYKNLIIQGAGDLTVSSEVKIHYESEITRISKVKNSTHPLQVTLSNREEVTCDLIISATGITARKTFTSETAFDLTEFGEIKVNEHMETNVPGIYAAGDVCSANWDIAKHWFQMKLWTQARQMGSYAARCMSGHLNNEEILQDFCFEMFAHSTKLFGYKVILLGLFNGQKLGTNYEILIRMTKGHEYVKFVLENNKLQGAVLIGDTDLEEMAENLILNQIDLSPYGDDILNPDIDIEDYFD